MVVPSAILAKFRVGGTLRNYLGDLLFAFSAPMGTGSNNEAEIEAAIFGLTWCLQLGYKQVYGD